MADRRKLLIVLAIAAVMLVAVMTFVFLDPYAKRFDAEYVGSETCGECHTLIYDEWQRSPHANMTRRPTPRSVVGDFDGGAWTLPVEARADPDDESPVARMYRADDRYYMAMRHPRSGRFVPFEIAYVIGYQYRQVYLTRERDGVLRRLPLQWSVERQEFFPYWNLQEGSTPTLEDLWIQTGTLHSAWNLYCARCHTTHLTIHDKDERHRGVPSSTGSTTASLVRRATAPAACTRSTSAVTTRIGWPRSWTASCADARSPTSPMLASWTRGAP